MAISENEKSNIKMLEKLNVWNKKNMKRSVCDKQDIILSMTSSGKSRIDISCKDAILL